METKFFCTQNFLKPNSDLNLKLGPPPPNLLSFIEKLAPAIDWGRSWLAICVPGLTPEMRSFLWKMLHRILLTQDRLNRMNMPNAAPSPLCVQCTAGEVDDIEHALLRCNKSSMGKISYWKL